MPPVPHSRETLLSLYLEARNYIDVELVRLEPRLRQPGAKVRTALEFNRRLGNPQAAYPTVQIAGTSGKGSTAQFLSNILSAAGHRTGLHISPYLQVATEKTWTDGLYAGADEFHRGYSRVREAAEHYRYRDDCPTSVHGMASLALSYEVFKQQQVEWCVMETGVGGRFDLVQGLDRKLAVITDLGLDHTGTLGETLKEIAWHKAGIMAGAQVAVAVYNPGVWSVFEHEAAATGCRLVALHPEDMVRVEPCADGDLAVFSPSFLKQIEVPWGESAQGYLLRNAAVAVAAADALAQLGAKVDRDDVVRGLSASPMPGRVERVQTAPEVFLDGAHNPQKLSAMFETLPLAKERTVLVLAATGDRRLDGFLAAVSPPPDVVVATRPLLYGKKVASPRELAARLRGWARLTVARDTPHQAVTAALELAGPDDRVLITGSLYLVGQARNYWYPWQEVLLQRTSYPQVRS